MDLSARTFHRLTRPFLGALIVAVIACDSGRPELMAPVQRTIPPRVGSRDFSLSSDPSREILRLSSFPGSNAEVTAYTLYGGGLLVWRSMAKRLDPGIFVIEIYDGYHVTQRREARLTKQQMHALIEPLVSHGLVDPAQGTGQKTTDGARPRDLGALKLELDFEAYSSGGRPAAPRRVVLRLGWPAGQHSRFALVGALHRELNEYLGLIRIRHSDDAR